MVAGRGEPLAVRAEGDAEDVSDVPPNRCNSFPAARSQSRTVKSTLPETSRLPSALKASDPTGLVCPLSGFRSIPAGTSQSRTRPSPNPAATVLPSGLRMAIYRNSASPSVRAWRSLPVARSHCLSRPSPIAVSVVPSGLKPIQVAGRPRTSPALSLPDPQLHRSVLTSEASVLPSGLKLTSDPVGMTLEGLGDGAGCHVPELTSSPSPQPACCRPG
jgi:hypothetical protein